MSVLVLTYHAVEPGPPPLCIAPSLFEQHVEAVVGSGIPVLTISQVADALLAGRLPKRAVAITFDDGASSVVRNAMPLLAEHGLPATVFCVSGHLGGRNDWSSQRSHHPRFDLATGEELAELARAGFEIGSHGTHHEALAGASRAVAEREIVDSRRALEQHLSAPIRSFAYPYGSLPTGENLELVRATYSCACGRGFEWLRPTADVYALLRVDAHYVRQPERFRRALDDALGTYLQIRRVGARIRRALVSDHV